MRVKKSLIYDDMGLNATKTVFRQRETQTSLLRYRDKLENWNFACSKFRSATLQTVNNNKDADQSVRMHKLACAFVVRKA